MCCCVQKRNYVDANQLTPKVLQKLKHNHVADGLMLREYNCNINQ